MSFLDKFKNKHDQEPVKSVKGNNEEKTDDSGLSLAELKEKQTGSKTAVSTKSQVKKEDTKHAFRILIRPMITEKGTYLAAENKYLFEVASLATKTQVKKAVKDLYGVTAVKVNIINVLGKQVRYGRNFGKTKDVKKALVTLKSGESINIYEGV